MAHLHSVYDTDKQFVIDATTMEITALSEKLSLRYKDHKSERYTFEMPRYIEGHDMSLCNLVQAHYNNYSYDSSTRTTTENRDYDTIEDMQVSPDDEDVIIWSWNITRGSTSLIGNLSFSFHFACISDDGTEEYAKNTGTFDNVTIEKSFFNSEHLTDTYSGFVERMEALAANIGDLVDEINGEVI